MLEVDSFMFDVRDIQIAKSELMKFKAAGGRSLADCQPVATGRAARESVSLSEQTGLHIISCTGFHMQAFYPGGHWTFTASREQLADIYVSEIVEGMYIDAEYGYPGERISARAGFIKNATELSDFDETDKRRLRAAADANKLTGAPLLCHTRRSALTHIPFLLDCGVDPESIIVAHLDKSGLPVSDYHLKIAELGVFLEFDNIVNARVKDKKYEIELIMNILDAGYKNRLLLGSDPTRGSFKSYSAEGQGLDYIASGFLKLLEDAGVSQEDIRDMTVNTPSRAFSFVPKV